MLAECPIHDIKGFDKLTDDEQMAVDGLSVILQNDLSEMQELLEKLKLKY